MTKPDDMCKCGQIFVSHIHSGVEGGHTFELAAMVTPKQKADAHRESDIRRLMARIGETFTLGPEHFVKLWPTEPLELVREAIERLKNPAPREGQPR